MILSSFQTLTAAVVLSLTAAAGAEAQTPAPQAPQVPIPSGSSNTGKAVTEPTSADYLERARTILNSIPDKPPGEDADKLIADLKSHFAAMSAMYRNEKPAPAATTETAPASWKDLFSTVERDIVKIIGAGSALGPATGGAAAPVADAAIPPPPTPPAAPGAAVPTAGQAGGDVNVGLLGVAGVAKVSTIGIKDLDPQVRKQVERFRTEVELFYTRAEKEAARTVTKEIK
jgi:hypothetical protein